MRPQRRNGCVVYGLTDPDSDAIRYVGQTRLKPAQRLAWHVKEVRRRIAASERLSPAQQWICSILVEQELPRMVILAADAEWDIAEAVWIDRLRRAGARLLNVLSVVSD